MPLVHMKDMVAHAYRHGYAVGAFDVVGLAFVQGIVDAAERCRAPVIISLAESHFDYFDFELLMPAVEAAARRASVPVAIHLDHGGSFESAVRGVNLGCNSVMVDASHEPFAVNVDKTRQVVEMAHACGIPVEGELGYVPGVQGEDAQRHPGELAYTTAPEAQAYVQRTGVDFLAVSIGTVHGRMKGRPKLNYARLRQINETLGIPLVLHGGTGLSDEQFARLIADGVAKINYFTALSEAAGERLRQNARAGERTHTALLRGVADAIGAEAERCMRVWGSAGRAAEVLTQCRPWQPVEHLIFYNAALEGKPLAAMMAEGERVLAAIPGVRDVFAGSALRADARYRHAWRVRFCHPAVIESYRDHPLHEAFADQRFRPTATDRVSIDFQATGPRNGNGCD